MVRISKGGDNPWTISVDDQKTADAVEMFLDQVRRVPGLTAMHAAGVTIDQVLSLARIGLEREEANVRVR